MRFLRNLLIRRVVMSILLVTSGLILVAGAGGAAVLHKSENHSAHAGRLFQQSLILNRVTLQPYGSEEQAALLSSLPAGAESEKIAAAAKRSSGEFRKAVLEQLALLEKQREADDAYIRLSRHRLEGIFISTLMAVLALLVFCDRYLVAHLVRPVDDIRSHLMVIAGGDLTAEPRELGRNCVGQLVPLIKHMQDSLLSTVVAIQESAESVQIAAEVIAEGNGDLSNRTMSQAAALEETAASMEQLSSSVRLNASSAGEACALAELTTQTTRTGASLVSASSSAMASLEAAAERIRQFTGTINSIAFQTNILSLNAAVEAARAGEEGRGFAVVASEVRMLAQRSAEAAKEIEDLISETVLRITEGRQMTAGAGEAMQDVLKRVESVNALLGQINLASGEQSNGISQVTTAVAELDRVTQQNSTLVQTVMASAETLRKQTAVLSDVITRFRLPESQPAGTHRSEAVPGKE
ncbi:hypothetical protein XB02_18980 [Pantoea ananatis]|nr:hypothetical protein XB02_18980 [Pantoea ananatis]